MDDNQFNINTLPRSKKTEKYIRVHYPEIYDKINKYPMDLSWSEKMYWYTHDIQSYPVCYVCGKQVDFINSQKGYRKYCSRECTAKSVLRIEKCKSTCLQTYGVSNVSKLEGIKNKKRESAIEHFGGEGLASENIRYKYNDTCKERYGTPWAISNQEIKDKSGHTLMMNYGVDVPLKSKEILSKQQQTCAERYGNVSFSRTDDGKKIISNARKVKYKSYTGAECCNNGWKYPCPHPECNICDQKSFESDPGIYYDRKRLGYEVCTILNPKYSGSTGEHKICSWLDDWKIDYIKHDRTEISPKELDIYIPSKHIAIEYNGIFYHSTKKISDRKYHINKWKECKDNGIQLITIWEDQMLTKEDIVKSILASKLGIFNTKIYARKCIVKSIDSNTGKAFVNDNHIQGAPGRGCYYGAYYNDNLVSVMVFARRSKVSGGKNDDSWELTRFCAKKGYKVIGIASKLMAWFITDHHPSKVISFSSNDISNGNLYKRLGFNEDSVTSAYWYVDSAMIRYHRSSFSKSSLKHKGYDIDGKTEYDITENIPGLFRIYDSGHIKWEKITS